MTVSFRYQAQPFFEKAKEHSMFKGIWKLIFIVLIISVYTTAMWVLPGFVFIGLIVSAIALLVSISLLAFDKLRNKKKSKA
ncbi:MAG: hypothetical protein Q8N63_09150 [Nanoarchaeota archaeon]|nr:hypothetical protein [Nanoarchaeota archaeon]